MAVVGDAVVEVVEGVGGNKVDLILDVVQFGVPCGDGEDYFGGVDGGDVFASRHGGVDGEAAGVRAAIQDAEITVIVTRFTQLTDKRSIVALVDVKPRFVPFGQIDQIFHPVLSDFNLARQRSRRVVAVLIVHGYLFGHPDTF